MARNTGGFKNVKLGKNVYRQLKRRGVPPPVPDRRSKPGDVGTQKDKRPK